jgi:hypothetical protein
MFSCGVGKSRKQKKTFVIRLTIKLVLIPRRKSGRKYNRTFKGLNLNDGILELLFFLLVAHWNFHRKTCGYTLFF